MNWVAIGAVGEIMGAGLVAVSVLYLAVQIRQSARVTQAGSRDAVSTRSTEFLLTVAADAESMSLWHRGMTASGPLDAAELMRFEMLLYAALEGMDASYSQWSRGTLTDADWQKWKKVLRDYKAQPGFSESWSHIGENFTQGFREYLDGLDPGRRWAEYEDRS